jgi:hypothetical protein
MLSRTERIRALNGRLRTTGLGGAVVLTRGIVGLPQPLRRAVLAAVAAFDRFDRANDPYGEHDFGRLEVEGERVFFKIDYYDPPLSERSADPADPAQTLRVLTIMLASEH